MQVALTVLLVHMIIKMYLGSLCHSAEKRTTINYEPSKLSSLLSQGQRRIEAYVP